MKFKEIGRSLYLAAAVLAFAQDGTAIEGVTLINQKAALSGKVTNLDTPGFPVTISEPGSYRLSGNIVVPDANSTAIEITSDNVTLDLNGFTISGPNSCQPNPIRCTQSGSGIGVVAVGKAGAASPANVKVMNGFVRGMGGHGIRMMGNGTFVQNVVSMSNGGPGIVVGEGSVIDSVATLNASNVAIVGLIVRGCTASNNVFGIAVRPGGIASGNVVYSNSLTGITLNNATATGNTSNNNGSYGIDAVCPGVLSENTATGNASTNIRTTGACTLVNNTI